MKSLFFLIFLLIPLCGCSTWGYQSRIGDEIYPPVPYQHVQVLYNFPNHPFKQIGFCSVLGGSIATDVDMYRKLQKVAAKLGADAVVVTGESVSQATLPGYAYTSGQAYGRSTAAYNPYMNTAYGTAYGTSSSTTTFMSPTVVSLPKNRGIAIKYVK